MSAPESISARRVQATIATCLAEPDRAEAVAAALGDPLDLEAVRYLAGLAEKVRHNGVRADLELTFRLLRLTGLEMELFRDYAPGSARRRARGLTAPADRLAGLVEFADSWAGTDPDRSLIRDLARYEQILADFRIPAPTPGVDAGGELGPETVLVRLGRMAVLVAGCDPAQVAEVLRAREPELAAVVRRPRVLLYHQAADAGVRAIEVSSGVPGLLAAVDGVATVRELALRLLGDEAATGMLAAGYAQLRELGLVGIGDGPAPCG
jgi:hypothetical protein